MKQRLGIAAALLPILSSSSWTNPRTVSTPPGSSRSARSCSTSVPPDTPSVVSSHLLSEVESICSYVVVIRFGVLVFSGPIEQLMDRAETRVEITPESSATSTAPQRPS